MSRARTPAEVADEMMSGKNELLVDVLSAGRSYEIPAYQRGYQWDEVRWQDLIRDIVEAATKPVGQNGEADPYWIGIMIVSNVQTPGGGVADRTLRVIDGQQRLVTLICWLRALHDHAVDCHLPVADDPGTLASIAVQEKDRMAMDVILTGGWRDAANRDLLTDGPLGAYCYFRKLLHRGDGALMSTVPLKRPPLVGLTPNASDDPLLKIQEQAGGALHSPADLYEATLQHIAIFGMTYTTSDNAEAGLFDALNGKRTELEPLDYMRSTLFVRLRQADAQSIYDKDWKPRETTLYDVKLRGVQPGRNFPYDFLIALGDPAVGEGLNASRAHVAFSRLLAHHGYQEKWLKELVTDKLLPAMTAWPAVVGEQDFVLRKNGKRRKVPPAMLELMRSIFTMSRQPVNPLVLHIVCAWNAGALTEADAVVSLEMAESYVARWILAGTRLNNLRADIMSVMARLRGATDPARLREELLKGQWVGDAEITDGARLRPFYDAGGPRPAALGALLRGIERHQSGGVWPPWQMGTGKGDYTVEHIYPQKPRLWEPDLRRWRQLGADMDERLHCLGNLTVVTSQHNKRVKNKPLADKQTEASLVNAPMLHINKTWMTTPKWKAQDIDARTDELIGVALQHWKHG